jgi:hypothetical protein
MFADDCLHLSEEDYRLWQAALAPFPDYSGGAAR